MMASRLLFRTTDLSKVNTIQSRKMFVIQNLVPSCTMSVKCLEKFDIQKPFMSIFIGILWPTGGWFRTVGILILTEEEGKA